MHTAGLIIAIFGGVVLFCSLLGLSCLKSNENQSAAEAFGEINPCGLIGFFRDLFRTIAEGYSNRSSPAFPLLVLFGASVGLLVVGGLLVMMSGS